MRKKKRKKERKRKMKRLFLLLSTHLSLGIPLLCTHQFRPFRPHVLNMIIASSFTHFVPSGISRAPGWRHDLGPGTAVRGFPSLGRS